MIRSFVAPVAGLFVLFSSCASYAPLPGIGMQEPVPEVREPRAQEADEGGGWGGTGALLIGVRQLADDDNWDPVDSQFLLGGEFAFRPRDSVLGFEFGASWSIDTASDVGGTGIDVTGTVYDFYLGPRLTFDLSDRKAHPYIGAGVAFINAEFEGELGGLSISDDDSTAAGYAHVGVLFEVSEAILLGLDGRATFGSDVTLFNVNGDVDSYQIAALIGLGW